LKSE